MVIVEAEVEDHGDGAPQEKQMIIESRDGGKTFTVNGETISAEAMAEIQAQHGIVKDVIDVDGGQFITTQSAEEIPATFELKSKLPESLQSHDANSLRDQGSGQRHVEGLRYDGPRSKNFARRLSVGRITHRNV
jgi:hypothetical protein